MEHARTDPGGNAGRRRIRSAVIAASYADASFRAPPGRCERLTQLLLGRLGAGAPVRVLDIGCGGGEQITSLAAALPNATFTGVDISVSNVQAAVRQFAELGLSRRARAVQADYVDFRPAQTFDVILSYSTLHLIPAADSLLFPKIRAELSSAGRFLNVMPFDCLYNRALMLARRGFRAVRSPLTDSLFFAFAKLLHGSALSDPMLRERIPYMYQVPHRLAGARLDRVLSGLGLAVELSAPEPHASLAQPKHRLTLYRVVGEER